MRCAALPALRWDLFCRVIDNHGDLGVCWRLARRLVALGQRPRLWIDDARALAWMAPHGAHGVEVQPWRAPAPHETPGDVVVEAFGCDPPAGFVQAMVQAPVAPVWINLEYLSAEAYTARSHGLPSPQHAGPGAGLTKWFFYPGFAPGSGGLLHEHGLAAERSSFDAPAWLAARGITAQPGAQRVSLFCYAQPALPVALAQWCGTPTQLLVAPGPGARQVAALLGCDDAPGTAARRGALEAVFLPWLAQPEYDRLLWSCHLNLVRGEDTPVRALWAGRPFLWQLYPQHDEAHTPKLEAFMDWYLEGAPAGVAAALRACWRAWNATAPPAALPPAPPGWAELSRRRRDALEASIAREGDLAERLCRFALAKR